MALHRRALSGAFAALILAGPAAAQRSALDAEELYDRVSPSIWLVENDMGGGKGALGSAVVIAPGTLITNCHVVAKARSLHVRHERRRFEAQLQYRDPVRDLCQLQAPGLRAPAVRIAAASQLHVGAKVYALGNPRGLELTLSDGLVSALRRDRDGELKFVQISVPISHGSSGGGLFDTAGRLVGITTAGVDDAQNLNFALPAEWILQLPMRAAGEAAVATLDTSEPQRPATTVAVARPAPPPAPAAPAVPAPVPAPQPAAAPPAVAAALSTFDYEVRDGLTGGVRKVTWRMDPRDRNDAAASLAAALGGEFAAAMPPGGWIHGEPKPGAEWTARYRSKANGMVVGMDLKARAIGESTMRLNARNLRIVGVQFSGYTERGGGAMNNPPGAYSASLWYSPELGRVVRFEARSRGGLGMTSFVIDEQLELVDARAD